MTSNTCAIFKIFLKDNGNTEVRKFVVDDASVITSFVFMKEKLQTLYPKLRESYFRITWRDADGDDIIIDNDEDLIMAYTEMDGQVKTLYVTVEEGKQKHHSFYSAPHIAVDDDAPNVICDVCNNRITTYRYKCLQCYDYDLCGACEQAGHHSHHMMLRSSTPDMPFSRCGRRVFDQVNKAVKKANHMAYRDCKKRSKWDKKGKPEGDNVPRGEGTSKQDQSSCPFEEYVPHFYPLIDVIANAASNAANAAANVATAAATASATTATPPSAPPTQEPTSKEAPNSEDHATSQFIELVRNALSSVFVQPPQPNTAPQQQNVNGQQAAPAANQQNAAEKPNQPQTQTNVSAPMESEIDLTATSPVEPMDTNIPQRDVGWTILNSEPTPQMQYPVLEPTMTEPQEPQDPVLAVGLQQLVDMGFSDRQALVALLRRYNGSVTEVIKHIFENK